MLGKDQTRRVRVLVKAFPQPSKKYDETVCVAAVDEDSRDFVRLFPIRYRRLPLEHRFDRFDQLTLSCKKASDPRPESLHVSEESIRVTHKGSLLSEASKVQLWSPLVAPSLAALYEENKLSKRSLGVIRPDVESVRFFAKKVEDTDAEDQAVTTDLFEQASLLEDKLKPLPRPTHSFGYSFTSGGKEHACQIHDWEVQTAFYRFKARYGGEGAALQKLSQEYGENIPKRNLHFIMGTMQARPWQFIVIGLLRSALSPDDVERQGSLNL